MRAHVEKINGFSAHADRDELYRWLSALKQPPRRLFVTHGEAETSDAFASWLTTRGPWSVTVPSLMETVPLD